MSFRDVLLVVLTSVLLGPHPVCAQAPGKDLRLAYVSQIDATEQPYRLYVPTVYDGRSPLPLIVALHGTGQDETTLFEAPKYGSGAIKMAAEKHGVLLVSPLGRGTTEFRGIGENGIFCVLEDVRKRYRVAEDRIYVTGHSMGGSGSAYLALHHPDLFAAAAPLAAPYSFPWLARNAGKTPFLWIGGADDLEFYLRGVDVGVERMRKFGAPVKAELLPGEGHYGPVKDFDRVFAWLLQHKLQIHPREYFFEVDTPLHGRAWWTTVTKIAEPGKMASIHALARNGNQAHFTPRNIAEFTFAPDPQVFTAAEIQVFGNGSKVFQGTIPDGRELHLRVAADARGWEAMLRTPKMFRLTGWREHPVAVAPKTLDMSGIEKPLANWIVDAMRHATGADLAMYNAYAYRGLPIPEGTVDIVDLIQCSRPFEQYLVTVEMTGRDLVEILDENLPGVSKYRTDKNDSPGAGRLVQLSGARYRFDLSRPPGRRIVESDLVADRIYTVALEGHVVERGHAILLGHRFKRLDYRVTGIPFSLALYGYAARSGRIEARVEGRVQAIGRME